MKTITAVKWMAAFMLAASLSANAQKPSGGGAGIGLTNGAKLNRGQGGPSGQHQRPSPEQMTKHLMETFDANKDGELSQDELTKAVEFLREHHRQGPGGGQQGGQQGAVQLGTGSADPSGQHQSPPPADKVAAKMIEKFSSDKTGLTQAELTKALEEHRANHGQQGGGQPGGPGTGSTNQTSSAGGI